MSKLGSRALVVGFSLLALAAFAACGGDEAKPAAPQAPAEEPAPVAEPAPMPEPAPTEDAAVEAAPAASAGTPFACIAGNADAGKVKYVQFCSTCHGMAGAGDGPASAGLVPKPAHHNDGAYMNALSNEHLVKVITEGGLAVGKSIGMAPWGPVLGKQGVLDVAAFVRTLATPAYVCP
jgi:mono/diheme cytochrome c family protein